MSPNSCQACGHNLLRLGTYRANRGLPGFVINTGFVWVCPVRACSRLNQPQATGLTGDHL